MRATYYGLTFQSAVQRREQPLVILRVDAGDGQPPRRAVEALRAGALLVVPVDGGYVVGCAGADAHAVARLCDLLGLKREQLMRFSEPSDPTGAKVGKPTPVYHPVTIGLMRAAGLSIVATPVPPGADPAPTAQHVVFQLGDAVDLVLDAGPVAALASRR
jgi:tRNA A37 threonylcarbamoyladenosine synthetase subunit TsaC/SUA5/YrdC